MSLLANRRSVMTLFAAPDCPDSHRARIVVAEKDIAADIIALDPAESSEDLTDLNPYNSVPTLVDRDLVLYDPRLIIEYLDERFPHPPLMPVDPVSRAKTKLLMYRIERDWYTLIRQFSGADKKTQTKLRKRLRESLLTSTPLFMEARPYLFGEEFSLVDCSVIPVLWRLEHYGVQLPPAASAITDYARRMFARPAVRSSLSEVERDMYV
ncbi:glutathione S-transferase N-terminal domain-containing protein [Acidihalobacter ferrooxydans]|uniref:Stringent starvation protein A n=1 Tax=Acidihalobacter ferrooxydans TaxID=1765967 RepID=A0A1P8UI83_9GAMM|nr:glutathione S-transferase N-terminal domain-containing protein [Acidihalobacter ferrooxydans]APZ43553.1 stringent starvation protein A [Acidihalobacter ferrooxydans]